MSRLIRRCALVASIFAVLVTATVPYVRPPPSQRQMNSTFINSLITNVTAAMADPDLATLFSNCFPNTLDTTVQQGWTSEDAFIITGDIPAMWLRDSTNQLFPYLPFLNDAPELRHLVQGVVKRQQRSVLLDSYANAFNYDNSGNGHPTDLRDPPMTPGVFEGKYELDSLCAVIKLTYHYVNVTNDTSVLDDLFRSAALKLHGTIFNATLGSAAAFEANNDLPFYRFLRVTPWEYDVFPKVLPVPTNGMARSAFRPSDDSTQFDFLIPSNAMAVVELNHLSELCVTAAKVQGGDQEFVWLAEASKSLADRIQDALEKWAVVPVNISNVSSAILAYEVDGLGQVNLMDDPNIPSLLSLPLIGAGSFTSNVAPGTRSWLLSPSNPYYYCGTIGCGLGSPHTPPGWVWPMAVMVRALTSDNKTEVAEQLAILKASGEQTGWMHESFNPYNASQFTRSWFAWANTLFGQTILDVGAKFPDLIYKTTPPPHVVRHRRS